MKNVVRLGQLPREKGVWSEEPSDKEEVASDKEEVEK